MKRLLVLVVAGLLLPLGAAQAQEIDQVRIASVSAEDYPTVRIQLTAPPEVVGGQLAADQVTVSENGAPHPATVIPTSTENLDVVLVVDTSGSMRADDAIIAARVAAADFVSQMPEGTNFGLIEFSTEPSVVLGITDDASAVTAAIQQLEADGETALYDAAAEAMTLLTTGTGSRQIVVLLSDGGDTSSTLSRAEAVAVLEASEAALYAIELITPDSDTAALEALAGATEGRLVTTPDASALQSLYAEVAADLLNRYEVAYESSGRGVADVVVEMATADGTLRLGRQVSLPLVTPAVEAPSPLPAPPPVSIPEVGLLDQPWVLGAGAAVVFVGLSALLVVLLFPGRERGQLSYEQRAAHQESEGIPRWVGRLAAVFERPLERRSWGGSLNRALEQAGLHLRPAELVTLATGAALLAALVGLALGGWLLALLLAVAVALAPGLVVSVLKSRRQDAFGEQLSDTLQLLASNLRAGHGLMQAIAAVAEDAESPTSEELSRVLAEARIGRDVSEALEAMDRRMDSIDFSWVVQAIAIHRDVGGDLAQVLEEVADTIRDRNQIRGQIRALSAEGRLSAIVLVAMPIVAAIGLFVINPEYLAELVNNRIGWYFIGGATVAMVLGTIWIRRVVKVVF